jgi:hypothetical protein
MYLKSNYRLTKKFCDGSNFLSDLELDTQFLDQNNPTSSVNISSFQIKLGYKRMATREIDGKTFFKESFKIIKANFKCRSKEAFSDKRKIFGHIFIRNNQSFINVKSKFIYTDKTGLVMVIFCDLYR